MRPLRERADYIIDTSKMTNYNLKIRLKSILQEEQGKLSLSIVSFGFKNGILEEADLVFDMRFLPNPYYIPELKPHNGLSEETSNYVLGQKMSGEFINYVVNYIKTFGPGYVAEGKETLTIGIGCTGGFHRSVAMAEALGQALREEDFPVVVGHRDLGER